MAPRELSKHQLSSRLSYNEHTPAFLRRLQNKVSGVADNEEEEDFYEWQTGSGRPPIPRRPTPPQRPANDHRSANEDDPDEKPQVVVLREGKHLTAEEAERIEENERRKARGLPPLSDDDLEKEPSGKIDGPDSTKQKTDEKEKRLKSASLSFSSSGSTLKGSSKKRKGVGDGLDELIAKEKANRKEKQKPRAKKAKTGALLSFQNDDG